MEEEEKVLNFFLESDSEDRVVIQFQQLKPIKESCVSLISRFAGDYATQRSLFRVSLYDNLVIKTRRFGSLWMGGNTSRDPVIMFIKTKEKQEGSAYTGDSNRLNLNPEQLICLNRSVRYIVIHRGGPWETIYEVPFLIKPAT